MFQAERCYARVLDSREASKYFVELVGDSRLASLHLPSERHGAIDPSQTEILYSEEELEKRSHDSSERPDIGEVILVHLSIRGDHVFRWQKLPTEGDKVS
jgi:hypothetical protein